MITILRTPIRFTVNPERIITRYMAPHGPHGVLHIRNRIARLSDEQVDGLLADTRQRFSERHRNLDADFKRHYVMASQHLETPPTDLTPNQQLLLGACLTMEYATQAAALFNPSVVVHPDQSGLEADTLRFVMSLRATGEGHVSSIEFRTGTMNQAGLIHLDEADRYATPAQRDETITYTREFVRRRLAYFPHTDASLLDTMPDSFDLAQATEILAGQDGQAHNPIVHSTRKAILGILDTNYDLRVNENFPLHEQVIFPNAKAESKGMEDLRFVQFRHDDGSQCYYSTYTATDGHTSIVQLLETSDFIHFSVRTLYGSAIEGKGMALFPEKVNGRYVMIGRQGGQDISIMFSDDLYFWETYQLLLKPAYPWEIIQLGNCGSPLKTDQGWLLLTHAVGPVRRYVIGAVLLKLDDPTQLIGRLSEPLIAPLESEREGYVPNVVYTCGWLAYGQRLLIPYAMSDSACGIITLSKQELLDELLTSSCSS